MASPDILTLSSSPPRVFRAFHIPSSPALRSPNALSEKISIGRHNEEDRIAENRSNLLTTKSTLAALVADDLSSASTGLSHKLHIDSSNIVQLRDSKPTKGQPTAKEVSGQDADKLGGTRKKKLPGSGDNTKVKKPRRKKADSECTDSDTVIQKRPRELQSKNAEESKGGYGIKVKAVRKPRTKRPSAEAQAKLPISQVTKHALAPTSKSKKLDLVSRHFSTAVDLDKTSEDSSSSGLLEAVKRRTCWTPPKPTIKATLFINDISGVVDEPSSPAVNADVDQSSEGFSDLLGNFAFTGLQIPSRKKSSETLGTKKRKLIELITTNISTSKPEIAAAKGKGAKKKARTITDQATSAYRPEAAVSTEPAAHDGFKIPPKPRSKRNVKVSSKCGKGTEHAPILLSPESALKQVGNQDFVFGTSSQLAREESPTFLRDIHAAMQASNEIIDYSLLSDPFQVSDAASIGPEEETVPPAKRNLWSAAARDKSGQLLNVEMIDLSNSPVVKDVQDPLAVKADIAMAADRGVWHDIEEMNVDKSFPETAFNQKQNLESSFDASAPGFSLHSIRESSPGTLCMRQPSETIPRATQSESISNPRTAKSEPKKPDYSSYTSVELAKEIASYRFKPVKNRNHMIALLERCWEGRKRTALGFLETNAMVHTLSDGLSKSSSDKSGSPKRPIGRPRMTSTAAAPKAKAKEPDTNAASTIASSKRSCSALPLKRAAPKGREIKKSIDEISDSDSPLTPSPPRRRPSQIQTTPLPLVASTDVEESRALTPTSSQVRLFEHITRAVTSASPSKDPSNPSWHEKILLYDPIILEDLTVWLNTGALEKAGWDGEVHPGEVKRWCVSKSICCLWKENLRGAARTRF